MDISASTILVTGASSGIGRAIALDLARAGAEVVAVARSEEKLQDLADQEPSVRPLPCDLTDRRARAAMLAALGPVDGVVNNAGTSWIGALVDMPADETANQLALNVEAMVEICSAVLPSMLERDAGHIVNIGSILAFASAPKLTMYSATKAAVHSFTEGLRRELVGTDVRVSLVAPGPVQDTAALDDPADEDAGDSLRQMFAGLGTTPDKVADAVHGALAGNGHPTQRTVSVPALAGLTRVAGLPGADWIVDHAVDLARRAGLDL